MLDICWHLLDICWLFVGYLSIIVYLKDTVDDIVGDDSRGSHPTKLFLCYEPILIGIKDSEKSVILEHNIYVTGCARYYVLQKLPKRNDAHFLPMKVAGRVHLWKEHWQWFIIYCDDLSRCFFTIILHESFLFSI